ncbi:sugar transferase [Synechococcus sp. MIT S9508]|uniref:sugar transferase n=1 Tax=Synechococcus sp. MIT S9508 TaxID=1801629 RepID=UPI0007BB6AFE|nr:sugar transferase [Synechococcus sp. MIT S9508]KZR90629.1 UDP-N-acetylgalactosamine-undecaprenyl-phosphate N-acetylgalactosaminephosphotransferase [Synechococcus sp. MIT S9508]
MQERLALVGLALWDLISVAMSYNFVYWRRLGDWPGFANGLAVLLLVWICSSYLLGRYSGRPITGWRDSKYLRLGVVVALVLALFVFHSWFFVVIDAGTRFRGFLIPLLAIASILSISGQILVRRKRRRFQKWLLVLSDYERQILEGELNCSNVLSSSTPSLFSSENFESLFLKTGMISSELVDVTVAISSQVNLNEDAVESLLALRGQGLQIRSLVDWCEIVLHRVPPELIDQRWFIDADGFSIQPGRLAWRLKRLFDVLGASILIILTFPLMLFAMAIVRLEDGGSIFYSQIRTGLYGERLRIWKFRSMRENAESDGIQWAAINDSRTTFFGGLMRRLRIDELPQLFSVLSGKLSLIGPRPERPELEKELEIKLPHYRIRHWIRPGLSGWAQVNYPYGASVEDSRMKLSFDLYYVRNAGFFLDLLILLRTVRLVLKAEGAQPIAISR